MNPRLSVVVITPDAYATVARTMQALHRQRNRSELEILFCVPTRAAAEPAPSLWRDFQAVRILEIGPVRVIAEAKASATRQASAPLVVFAEEHAFPAEGWAEALIERHRESHAVVGPVMVNPNDRMAISWANFLIEYGPWMAPCEGGLRTHLPGNNSCYKRHILISFGDRLAEVLDAETLLHWHLGAAGHTLYLEPRAITRHVNITRLDSFRRVHYQYGRMFASQRSRGWSVLRRAVFAGGAVLIPLVRLVRLWPDIRRNKTLPTGNPSFWGFVALGLIDSACGEAMGYAAGPANSREHIFELEFHRLEHLHPADTVTGLSPDSA